jgi:hypothetical protein
MKSQNTAVINTLFVVSIIYTYVLLVEYQYCSVKTKKQKYVGWVVRVSVAEQSERNPTFSIICWFYTICCLRGNFR